MAIVCLIVSGWSSTRSVENLSGWLTTSGQLFAALTFTITRGKFVEIHVITDPEHLHQLDLAVLDA
jgi:hypothetical protein